MAKRRLSDQQKRRIARNKTQHLDTPISIDPDAQLVHGTIVIHYGRQVVVETAQHQQHTCKLRQNLGDIACGDRVVFQPGDDTEHGVVIAIDERDNLLQKTGFAGKAKPVAANVGQVVIVCAVEPAPNTYLIDRYLVAIENLPARTLLVVNKIDLGDHDHQDIIDNIDSIYGNIGYTVLHTSAATNFGLDTLRQHLKNTTSIFVGLSGVGKSSLVNSQIPDTNARVAEVSEITREGRHTTTVSSLYHLPGGGELIDSPGVRDFTPRIENRDDILNGFVELRGFRGKCKFANCSHSHEPGCAILEAVNQGKIARQRLESYKHMLSDLDEQ